MSYKEVADKFNLCTVTISKILHDIPKYTKAQIFSPNLNEHFFEKIDNEERAYFLGLIISDGNIFKREDTKKQASVSITLDLKDEYMLEKFAESVKTNDIVAYDGRGSGTVAIRSDIMAKDLEQYGITPRKSFNTYLPDVSDEWMSHLIRGIFDGDGSILMKPSPRDDGHNRYLHTISFCGTHRLMQDISDYIYNYLNLNIKPKVYDYKNRSLSEIKISNIHDIKTFGEYMYKDATVYLRRKYDRYLDFKDHYQIV